MVNYGMMLFGSVMAALCGNLSPTDDYLPKIHP
jgi:hypothetical protein